MELQWKINGETFESLGLTMVGGQDFCGAASTCMLERAGSFDDTPVLAYGAAVVITYYDAEAETWKPFFRGKVATVPAAGSDSGESQTYEVRDAWNDLETTVYQEPWGTLGGTDMIPRSVLGLDPSGTQIAVGPFLTNILTFADLGLDLAIAVTGMVPLPSDAHNVTCAELIHQCMKLHPDWLVFIDHRTSPNSTFRVIAAADAATVDFPVDGTGDVKDFHVVERLDLMPESVRITYETSATDGSDVYRKIFTDLWPVGGAVSGPRVLAAYVPLAGMTAEVSKGRLYTEPVPVPGTTSVDDEKAWLKKHWPQLADIPNGHFRTLTFARALVPEPADKKDNPISAQARRIAVEAVEDIPNELINGCIEDWMRLKVGEIKVTVQIEATEGATLNEKWLIGAGNLTPLPLTCTNAGVGNTFHKGLTSWEPGEAMPTGVAKAVYEGIWASGRWEGSVTESGVEIPVVPRLGRVANLTGGATAWASMRAMISSVDWDLKTRRVRSGFGPLKHLAPQDFIEQIRRLRSRPTKWFSSDERAGNKHGAPSGKASAAGDKVGGFDFPGGRPQGVVFPGGKNANITLNFWWLDCDLWVLSGVTMLFFRQGALISTLIVDSGALTSPPNYIDGYEDAMPTDCVEITIDSPHPTPTA